MRRTLLRFRGASSFERLDPCVLRLKRNNRCRQQRVQIDTPAVRGDECRAACIFGDETEVRFVAVFIAIARDAEGLDLRG
jgi:hypothetical protein